MADFSLTSLFVVPVGITGNAVIASANSTQDLLAGQVGFFDQSYAALTSGTIAAAKYWYVAQGRTNTYLQGSKRSDKISGKLNAGTGSNITEFYKVTGTATTNLQVTEVTNFNVNAGDVVTLTLRAHSSYIDTLYFNGLTRSVTAQAGCLACGGDPCGSADISALIDTLITKLNAAAPGINPDNISLSKFFVFTKIYSGGAYGLRIAAKPLTVYGQPAPFPDVAAFPFEYDRMYFRTFIYSGPATTADFIVADACNTIANVAVVQRASYPAGTSSEIQQLEKNFYSYQAGYLKHLYRMVGYNQNFESWVTNDTTYDTYYIRFNDYDKSAYQWGDYIMQDSTVIIAAPTGATATGVVSAILVAANGAFIDDTALTTSTTSSTTSLFSTTTTTSTLQP
jgi:hypothetical protein